MTAQTRFPEGKRFAFTVFDDTDFATVRNARPVYDLLRQVGLRTTKSAWVFSPRKSYLGQCLEDEDYLSWVLELQREGFEIALHNVGDGDLDRPKILRGLAQFEQLMGHRPRVHANHIDNADNLYWWDERFERPVSTLYRWVSRLSRQPVRRPHGESGSDEPGPRFWGDVALDLELYVRNLVFNDINTLRLDPRMPYHDPAKPWVKWWFSSSDGDNCVVFNDLIAPSNVDRLEREGGCCIVYTHFGSGFVDAAGRIDATFEERLRYLASKEDGWFVPVGTLLDHLRLTREGVDPGAAYRLALNVRWMADRLAKRLRYGF